MLLLNTAPQFVGASNTLHKTNIVETQSHYVDTIGLGVDLCTGLMACSFTSVAQPQMLIKHSSNFAHSRLSRLNLLLRRDLLKIQRLLVEVPVSPVGWLLILPSVDHHRLLRNSHAATVGSHPWAWWVANCWGATHWSLWNGCWSSLLSTVARPMLPGGCCLWSSQLFWLLGTGCCLCWCRWWCWCCASVAASPSQHPWWMLWNDGASVLHHTPNIGVRASSPVVLIPRSCWTLGPGCCRSTSSPCSTGNSCRSVEAWCCLHLHWSPRSVGMPAQTLWNEGCIHSRSVAVDTCSPCWTCWSPGCLFEDDVVEHPQPR